MQKMEVAKSNSHNSPAQRKSRGPLGETQRSDKSVQLKALAESSPQSEQLSNLAAMMETSSRQRAVQRFADQANKNPMKVLQRVEEEEPLQGKFESQGTTQRKAEAATGTSDGGLPNQLKSGIESLSGMSMDHVKVHYNSSQPAQLKALAYTQGSDIHVAPGQEQHLPHEAWHVVQQAQGRVQPTMQMKSGVPVNDDRGLEHEADVMGASALKLGARHDGNDTAQQSPIPQSSNVSNANGTLQARLATKSGKLVEIQGNKNPNSTFSQIMNDLFDYEELKVVDLTTCAKAIEQLKKIDRKIDKWNASGSRGWLTGAYNRLFGDDDKKKTTLEELKGEIPSELEWLVQERARFDAEKKASEAKEREEAARAKQEKIDKEEKKRQEEEKERQRQEAEKAAIAAAPDQARGAIEQANKDRAENANKDREEGKPSAYDARMKDLRLAELEERRKAVDHKRESAREDFKKEWDAKSSVGKAFSYGSESEWIERQVNAKYPEGSLPTTLSRYVFTENLDYANRGLDAQTRKEKIAEELHNQGFNDLTLIDALNQGEAFKRLVDRKLEIINKVCEKSADHLAVFEAFFELFLAVQEPEMTKKIGAETDFSSVDILHEGGRDRTKKKATNVDIANRKKLLSLAREIAESLNQIPEDKFKKLPNARTKQYNVEYISTQFLPVSTRAPFLHGAASKEKFFLFHLAEALRAKDELEEEQASRKAQREPPLSKHQPRGYFRASRGKMDIYSRFGDVVYEAIDNQWEGKPILSYVDIAGADQAKTMTTHDMYMMRHEYIPEEWKSVLGNKGHWKATR